MARGKRAVRDDEDEVKKEEPIAKRRSSRQAAAVAAVSKAATKRVKAATKTRMMKARQEEDGAGEEVKEEPEEPQKPAKKAAPKAAPKDTKQETKKETKKDTKKSATKAKADAAKPTSSGTRDAVTPDPDPADIPVQNPDVERHEGKCYWLLKAEPETRMEGGVDVRFSIDDLRARTKPEGWDGIRNYVARNNLRAMNAGDLAFFYHSNCKNPGIVGTMEIVREHSEDKSARRAGTPYYDAQSTREKPRWSLVHVEFRRKFAVPIYLPELRELGKVPGSPLEGMQLLKQSRLSVSKVSESEWEALCALADEKAKEAGLEHEE